MPKISNKEDRDTTRHAVSMGGGNIIKLAEGSNFVLLLSEDYEEGYTHWLNIGGTYYRRTCIAGIESKGWDPEACQLCALAAEMYASKKEALSEGDKKLADDYNDRGNDIRADYAAVFPAVQFKTLTERKKVKVKGKIVSKRVTVPDLEENFEIGKLSLTWAQVGKVLDLFEDDEVEHISEEGDLLNHILNLKKVKDPKKLYAELREVIASKNEIDPASLDIDPEDIPEIEDEFAEDDDLERVADLYRADLEGEDEEEYEEEELAAKKKTRKKKSSGSKKKRKPVEEEEDEEGEEGEESEDDFEDDIPF